MKFSCLGILRHVLNLYSWINQEPISFEVADIKETVLTYSLHLSSFYSASHHILCLFFNPVIKNSKTNSTTLFLKFCVLYFIYVIRSYLQEFIFYTTYFWSLLNLWCTFLLWESIHLIRDVAILSFFNDYNQLIFLLVFI